MGLHRLGGEGIPRGKPYRHPGFVPCVARLTCIHLSSRHARLSFHERDEIHLINRMLVSVFRPSLPRPKHPPPGAAAHGVKVVECLLSQRAVRRRREHQSGGARLHRLQCGSGVVACTLQVR